MTLGVWAETLGAQSSAGGRERWEGLGEGPDGGRQRDSAAHRRAHSTASKAASRRTGLGSPDASTPGLPSSALSLCAPQGTPPACHSFFPRIILFSRQFISRLPGQLVLTVEARKSIVFRCVVFSTENNSGLRKAEGIQLFIFGSPSPSTYFACPGHGVRDRCMCAHTHFMVLAFGGFTSSWHAT